MSQSLSQQFLTWCRSKPADEEYDYCSNTSCAYFQFLEASGMPVARVTVGAWKDTAGKWHRIPDQIQDYLASGYDEQSGRRLGVGTFGALVSRLEAALS